MSASFVSFRHLVLLLGVFVALLLMAIPQSASAQTATVDWEDAGVDSLTPFASGTQVSGSDGTVAQVDWTTQTDGGSFVPAFGGAFVSYFSGSIGGNASPLVMSFNNGEFDEDDRVIITITLDRNVRGLQFGLSDIDTGNFLDAVEVYYDDDLSGSFTNVRPTSAFWTTGSAVAETNNGIINGWRGIANAGNTSTNGNIDFDFGDTDVRRIQIVYFSNTGNGDPGNQFATISDFTFDETADLSLTKQLIGSAPANGAMATWRLTATNSSATASADGVIVRDNLPAQFVFESATGTGTFNENNGEWSVGSLAPGASVSIDITGTIGAPGGTTITNTAEIIASSRLDPDSVIDNGSTSEDDYAQNSFTVAASPPGPPALFCPAGTTVFDWDTVTWPGGSLSNTYQLGTFGQIQFDIVTDGVFSPRAAFGGAVPALTDAVSGGLSPLELALAYNKNNTDISQEAVTTITLPQVLDGAQFTVFDIDRSSTFEDRITAYGLLNGVRVNAVLTPGSSNTVIGDSIIGTSGANDATNAGNGTITFNSPIDTIVIEYGSGPGAPANPGNQSIAIHDITVCSPPLPSISVTKLSSIVSDPVNGTNSPRAIPGAIVEYQIQVSNTGQGATDADSVIVTDDSPADIKMCWIGQAGGPVVFTDPGSNSGLTYSFASLASLTDSLEFSDDDGVTWDYEPTADADGCDEAVTDFRVRPGGAFQGGSTFNLRARYQVE